MNLTGDSNAATVAAVSAQNSAGGEGVAGISKGGKGTGVHGVSDAGFGVHGESTSGRGVVAISDTDYGLRAASRTMSAIRASSVDGVGIETFAPHKQGIIGGSTTATGVHGVSVSGFGVLGESTTGRGVVATSDSDYGLRAASRASAGIRGSSVEGNGVEGWATKGTGVVGIATTGNAVAGNVDGPGTGVVGISKGGVGVWGKGGHLAGFFEGDVEVTGDLRLTNADCAEDFDVSGECQWEPGTVMVLGQEGALCESRIAYDKRVAGVISGAGDYRPAIVLDKQRGAGNRQPIALVGKTFCKVDAQFGAIEVGDLLTTSPTPGHAMKTDDPLRAFGAVIGKALRPVAEGQGLIPILIALQ
jgi:hypothetical protein